MKLYLDPGHGGSDPGARGNSLNEKDINLDIALRIRSILINEYENVQVRMSRTSDINKSLNQRTTEANSWGADFYLSIHCNAFNGSAQGYEDYIHSSLSDTSTTAKYQDIIHTEVMILNQLKDRGKKKADFHVLRETTMPAFLSENGFIDNTHDANLMKQSSWRQNVARGHVNGVAKAFNLKKKPVETGTIYKVIAGSFKTKENANERVAFLRSKGIESFAFSTTISGETWYRVQAGAFSKRENAEERLEEVKRAGISDAFIVSENPDSPNNEVSGYTILGETFLSAEQMNLFVQSVNPNAIELGRYYATIGPQYGIRGDVAFAQAMLETDYLRFTGTVQPDQNNFAGIGATGPDNPGARFSTPEKGVLAHIQHLYAYASTKPLPEKSPLVDPRFNLVSRGSATTWKALNGKWAVPGNGYGQALLNVYERLLMNTKQNIDTVIQKVNKD
ncbi:N-acetylmuramoyl-L-alanine amidase [Mesobacillus maritimus]|uniref:N-acetylmuramoyl-L-alanine amidase n=1 Tax=Mesobacillus maritimus TaxID=1643336 RepID=UPI00384CB18F